ncbi:hypothetical protein N7462_004333 [Penicillium macrosclerotiorum]|uniref:uncharacterized protein n=1 Tax=Penicillium macrosclerotiorum TaxID=303699 RepID=UPI002547FCEA|nr:uncharacterized protein N7462_004333 [Penicillium macrosclerotiorum]KAJ5689941.1 hypothetical protein N7462_004333 [Penicillium macrosclerotiorum]
MYLDAMSRQFGPFIKRVINHAEFTQSHTLLITALKVIQQSPFCENNWKDVVYHNSITGEILLYAEKDQLGFPWSSFDVKNKVASWRKYGLVHNEVYFNFVLNGDLNNKDFCNDMSVLKVKDSTWYIPKFYESLGDIFSVCLCILEKRSNSLLTWGINLKKMRATNYINELVVKELQEMLEKNVFEELGKFEQSDYQDIPLRQLFLVDRMLDSDLIIENIQYFKNLRAQLIGIMSDSLLKNLKDSAKYLRQWATDGRMTSKRSTELLWYIKSMIKDSMIKDSMNLILRQEACNVIAHWLHEEILDRNDLELDTDEQLPQLCPNLY